MCSEKNREQLVLIVEYFFLSCEYVINLPVIYYACKIILMKMQ